MGVYDVIKDALNFIQKYGNLELVNSLIDAQKQLLDEQQELTQLRDENKRLRDLSELEKKIVRHKTVTIVTVNDDNDKIFYCSRCWGVDRKLVQVIVQKEWDFYCPHKDCENKGQFDKEMHDEYWKRFK